MNRVTNIVKFYLEYMKAALVVGGFCIYFFVIYEQIKTAQISKDFYAATSAVMILALVIFIKAFFSVRRMKRSINKIAPRRNRIRYRVWVRKITDDIFRLILVIGAYELLKAIYLALLSDVLRQ